MNNILSVKIIDCLEYLSDGLRSIFLGKFSLIADPIEELAACCQLGDDVELVLYTSQYRQTLSGDRTKTYS